MNDNNSSSNKPGEGDKSSVGPIISVGEKMTGKEVIPFQKNYQKKFQGDMQEEKGADNQGKSSQKESLSKNTEIEEEKEGSSVKPKHTSAKHYKMRKVKRARNSLQIKIAGKLSSFVGKLVRPIIPKKRREGHYIKNNLCGKTPT